MSPSTTPTEFLIRFICAFIFFGFITAMLGLRFINAIDALNLTVWSIITISLSLLVAFRGNCAWHQLANLLRWW